MDNSDLKNKLENELLDYVTQPKKNLDDKIFVMFHSIM